MSMNANRDRLITISWSLAVLVLFLAAWQWGMWMVMAGPTSF